MVALACALAACSGSDPAQPGPEDVSVVGVWQSSEAGQDETTVQFLAGGGFGRVSADFPARRCVLQAGTWSETEGVLDIQITEADGESVSQSLRVPYQLDGASLTLEWSTGQPETFSTFGELPACASYGWPDFTLLAEVDGVPLDFGADPPTVLLEDAVADGKLQFEGRSEPEGAADGCPGCDVLGIELFTELASPLVPGEYPMEVFGPSGLYARAFLHMDVSTTDVVYRSGDGDPATQPPAGRVVLTSVGPDLVEGTFEFTLFDGGGAAGPPYPSVTVTNGYFRLSFE